MYLANLHSEYHGYNLHETNIENVVKFSFSI